MLVVVAAVAFGLGIALGQALSDDPGADGTQTRIRTLEPIQLPPARITVTVTTTGP